MVIVGVEGFACELTIAEAFNVGPNQFGLCACVGERHVISTLHHNIAIRLGSPR
jgi:hypothetical protein